MGLRTKQQFINSLKDQREVYYKGKRIPDVTAHPAIQIGIQTAAIDYEPSEDKGHRSYAVCEDDNGEKYSRYFHTPRTVEDLFLRVQLVQAGSKLACGFPPFSKEGGTDGLYAADIVTAKIDKEQQTSYNSRLKKWQKYLQQNDLSVAIAMSDVKGDRSQRPMNLTDPDHYVHMVEQNEKGIIVRGAKAHITTAPYTNELLVLPTRNLNEKEKDYAVAFAIPVDHAGVKIICREVFGHERNPREFPISSKFDIIEGLVIFDDVLVPWERVFMAGEYAYAGMISSMFANYHRLTAAAYKYSLFELLTGAAHLIAEYNGLQKIDHIREKLANLALHTETLQGLIQAACLAAKTDAETGILYPDPMLSNAAKFYFANNYHAFIKDIQDIVGGILVTLPSYDDWEASELSHLLTKYLKANSDIPTERRFRLLKLLRDLIASDLSGFWEVTTIHAEGSLASLRLSAFGAADWERYRQTAENAPLMKDM